MGQFDHLNNVIPINLKFGMHSDIEGSGRNKITAGDLVLGFHDSELKTASLYMFNDEGLTEGSLYFATGGNGSYKAAIMPPPGMGMLCGRSYDDSPIYALPSFTTTYNEELASIRFWGIPTHNSDGNVSYGSAFLATDPFTIEGATSTEAGLVTATDQTFAGIKTFDAIVVSGDSTFDKIKVTTDSVFEGTILAKSKSGITINAPEATQWPTKITTKKNSQVLAQDFFITGATSDNLELVSEIREVKRIFHPTAYDETNNQYYYMDISFPKAIKEDGYTQCTLMSYNNAAIPTTNRLLYTEKITSSSNQNNYNIYTKSSNHFIDDKHVAINTTLMPANDTITVFYVNGQTKISDNLIINKTTLQGKSSQDNTVLLPESDDCQLVAIDANNLTTSELRPVRIVDGVIQECPEIGSYVQESGTYQITGGVPHVRGGDSYAFEIGQYLCFHVHGSTVGDFDTRIQAQQVDSSISGADKSGNTITLPQISGEFVITAGEQIINGKKIFTGDLFSSELKIGTTGKFANIKSDASGEPEWSVYLPNATDKDVRLLYADKDVAIGTSKNPIYIDNTGKAIATTETVGAALIPMYLNGGVFTKMSTQVGSSTQPIFFDKDNGFQPVPCLAISYGGTGLTTFTKDKLYRYDGSALVATDHVITNELIYTKSKNSVNYIGACYGEDNNGNDTKWIYFQANQATGQRSLIDSQGGEIISFTSSSMPKIQGIFCSRPTNYGTLAPTDAGATPVAAEGALYFQIIS